MKDPFTRAEKNERGVATFSTKSERNYYKLPKNISKPKTPAFIKTRMGSMLAAILILFSVAFGGGWLGARTYNNSSHSLASSSTAAKQQIISDEGNLISSIAKTVGQSVVSVDVQGQSTTQDFLATDKRKLQKQLAPALFYLAMELSLRIVTWFRPARPM
jgi:hypothetical protein